jgi:hypothetical protein
MAQPVEETLSSYLARENPTPTQESIQSYCMPSEPLASFDQATTYGEPGSPVKLELVQDEEVEDGWSEALMTIEEQPELFSQPEASTSQMFVDVDPADPLVFWRICAQQLGDPFPHRLLSQPLMLDCRVPNGQTCFQSPWGPNPPDFDYETAGLEARTNHDWQQAAKELEQSLQKKPMPVLEDEADTSDTDMLISTESSPLPYEDGTSHGQK